MPPAPDWTATAVFASALFLAPELLGGVFPWGVAIICLLAGVTALIVSQRVPFMHPDRSQLTVLDGLVVAALLWTALQLVPLPAALVSFFVPEASSAWEAHAALFRTAPRAWIPLTLDPGATAIEVAKGSAIVAMFVSARLLSASRQRRRVLVAVTLSVTGMAVVALAHKLAGATKVFGLYEPVYASSRLLAPLMNENQLAGFMALGCPIALGLALDARRHEPRLLWAAAASVCAVACILSFSRGGIAALVVGVVVFLAAYGMRVRKSHKSLFRSRTLPIVLAGVLGVAIVGSLLAGGELRREFGYTNNLSSKFETAEASLPLIASHWATGVGRGAFSAAFVKEHGTEKRFYYPENLLVQWMTEWGLLVSIPLLIAILLSLARGFRRRRSNAHLGALCGLVALGVHEMVDFSLELVGVAVVAAAAFGAVSQSRALRGPVTLRQLGVGATAVSIAGALLALSLHHKDVFSLEAQVRTALREDDRAEVRTLVASGLSLHPSEPVFALAGAEVAVRDRDQTAGLWLNRAQELAPPWSAPHLVAARWLFGLGQSDQALLEIREAEARQPGSARTVVCELLRKNPDPEIALRAAPAGAAGSSFLDRASQCLPLTSPAATAIDRYARKRDPALPGPATREARRRLAQNLPEDAVAILRTLPDPDLAAIRTLTEAYLRMGNLDRAHETIAPTLGQRRLPSDFLKTATTIYVARREWQRVDQTVARLRRQAGAKPKALAKVELFLGRAYERYDHPALALRAYEAANRVAESGESLEATARVALQLGKRDRALLAYRRLCRLDGEKGPACERAAELSVPTRPGP